MQTPQNVEPISKQLTIVIGLTVVGFMAFGLALSFYRNILFDDTLHTMEDQNRQIAQNIDDGFTDLEYFRSQQYRDKFAKENLNKLNQGEKLIVVTSPPPSAFSLEPDDTVKKTQREAAYTELLNQMPILQHWNLYFFHKNELEELKQSL